MNFNARTALVVGANRGLGLAITRRLLENSGLETLYATHREDADTGALAETGDDRVVRVKVDVTDVQSIGRLARRIADRGDEPDLVVHCAGVLHGDGVQAEKSLAQCAPDAIARSFAINSIGPLMVARAIVPLMPRRKPGHFAALSAMVGSISDNRLGGWYAYRASKAALNQFIRTLSVECRRTHPGLCLTAIHPGTTDTGLSKPFQANVRPGKLYTPEQSAARILDVLANSDVERSGQFVNWDGRPIPA